MTYFAADGGEVKIKIPALRKIGQPRSDAEFCVDSFGLKYRGSLSCYIDGVVFSTVRARGSCSTSCAMCWLFGVGIDNSPPWRWSGARSVAVRSQGALDFDDEAAAWKVHVQRAERLGLAFHDAACGREGDERA